MRASMPHSRATPAESLADAVHSSTFECSPWLAQERVLEEPPARPQEPLRLAINENLVEQPLDGEAILRVG
jgi:hypothetical protein